MQGLTDEAITATFDQLVGEGVIVYGPHTKHQLIDNGYPMEFRICPALLTKPHTVGAPNTAFNHARKFGPGSDMFCPDERLMLTQLNNGSHDLALNLFCVDRPQLLLLTADSYKRQHEPLNADDLNAALELLKRWTGWYVIFNCGERGGCSRVHKHLQGLRGPPHAFDVLIEEGGRKGGNVPFKYFLHRFEKALKETSMVEVQEKYLEMLEQCKDALELEEGEAVPHNVILWERWLVIIPRNRGIWEGASANTGGMLGSVWVPDQSEVDKWLRLGCANVLRNLGVPS